MSSLDRFNDLHKTTNLKSEPSKCKCCEKKKNCKKSVSIVHYCYKHEPCGERNYTKQSS